MNTVTIALEEYLELRKIRDEIMKNNCFNVHYISSYSDNIERYFLLTNDEAVKLILKENQTLSEKIGELKLKTK